MRTQPKAYRWEVEVFETLSRRRRFLVEAETEALAIELAVIGETIEEQAVPYSEEIKTRDVYDEPIRLEKE